MLPKKPPEAGSSVSAVPGLGERAPCWAVKVLLGVQDEGLVAHTAAIATPGPARTPALGGV